MRIQQNPNSKREVISVLRICLKQNYFQFNDIKYKREERLKLVNPLSSLLAEIFIITLKLLGIETLHQIKLYNSIVR